MQLSNAQLVTLKNAINTEVDSVVVNALAANNLAGIADWYNEASSFIVWKTRLSHKEIVEATSDEATTWSWTDYIALSVSVKAAWELMFKENVINPSLANIRSGIADIFVPGAQRTHLLAIAKRPATRAENLYTTGTGSVGTPGLLVLEGELNSNIISQALAS